MDGWTFAGLLHEAGYGGKVDLLRATTAATDEDMTAEEFDRRLAAGEPTS
jgi:hypothetical protein